MKCTICGRENDINNSFCNSCGSSINQNSNNKIFKAINLIRIISSIGYITLLVFLFNLYIEVMTIPNDAMVAKTLFLEPLIILGIDYLAIIIFFNLICFNKNIASNIKVASIMEIIPSIFTLSIVFTQLFNLHNETIYGSNKNFILTELLIALVLLICPVIKLILLKKVSNYNIDEKIKNKCEKYKSTFIISCLCISIMLFFTSIAISSDLCDKNYDLNTKQLNRELKSYTVIDENTYERGAQGFNCRTKFKENYISFSDKYNNEVILMIDDSDKGKINNDSHVSVVATLQLVNNILKNKELKTTYNEHDKKYEIEFNDITLNNYFNIYIEINYKKTSGVRLYEFDLNNIPYKVNITLEQKDETDVDKEFIMPYIEKFVHHIYSNLRKENISEFELELNGEKILKINDYSSNKIIWK